MTGSPACSTTAVTTSPVSGSPYPITCSAGTLASTNYTFAFVAGELTVTPAVADIAVTGYTVPYDGLPHTATGTATGALGEDLAGLLDLSATTHTAAGTYPVDAWTFHDPAGNYADASGTVADAITAGTLVDHRRRPDQALRHHVHLRGHRVHGHRPRAPTASTASPSERGRRRHGHGRRPPVRRSPPRPRPAPGSPTTPITYVAGRADRHRRPT